MTAPDPFSHLPWSDWLRLSARITLDSPLPPARLRERLAARTQADKPRIGLSEKLLGPQGHRRTFWGSVGADGFRISRVVLYRNAFLPVVTGRIEPAGRGSRLAAAFALRPAVILFLLLWFALALAVSVAGLVSFAADPGARWLHAAVPLFTLAIAAQVASHAFWSEAREQARILAGIASGAEEEEVAGA